MGGCATKPKVTKDGGVDVKAPEPEPELEQVKEDSVETKVEAEKQEQLLQSGLNLDVNDIVDDDQANKRRSLSLLFNKEVCIQFQHSQHFSCYLYFVCLIVLCLFKIVFLFIFCVCWKQNFMLHRGLFDHIPFFHRLPRIQTFMASKTDLK